MPLLVTISREGSVSTETRRAAVTALTGLVALALPGAIASSDLADAALVDLGALVECDAQETGCPEDDLEPREQIGIVATDDRQPGDPRGGLPATPSSWSLNLVENVDTVYLSTATAGPHGRLRRYLLPASAFANASFQPSLMSATCDFMQCAIAPLPGLTSAQNCLTSALQALPTAAARMIAT